MIYITDEKKRGGKREKVRRDSRDRGRKVWEESEENRGRIRWRERHFWSLGMWSSL